MAKPSLKVRKISDALDLVPVSKRDCVEHVVANAIGQGLDKLLECFSTFEERYANSIMNPGCVHSSKQFQEITQLSKILRSTCYMTLRYLLNNLLQQAEANTNSVLHGKHVLSTANLIT